MASRGSGSRRGEFDGVDVGDRDPRPDRNAEKMRRARARQYRKSRAFRWVKRLVVFGLVMTALGALALAGAFVYYGSDENMPTLKGIGDYHPPQLTRVLDRDGQIIGELGAEKRTLVPFAQIPKILVQATVASEDADFYRHQGVDYMGMVRAMLENIAQGRLAQGASTITQQVIKMLLFTPEKTWRRKFQEIILARQISSHLTKDEILEIYLNHSYYGHGRYGCEEAARFYFGKSVSEINLSEAGLLGGVVQMPERLSPHKHPEAAKRRQVYVLGQMASLGFIDRATAQNVAAQPIAVIPQTHGRIGSAPEAVGTVYRRLSETHGPARVNTLGMTVKTTIDARLQELAREALERGLEDVDARQGYRGPTGHLTGRALEKHRAGLASARKGTLKDSEIVEGIVTRIEKDPANPKRGRLFVDVGAIIGAVDLAAEPRYARGGKPLAERFKPGDLVRVRSAPERRREEGKEPPLALELGPQAAMVVMDPHAHEVLALVGGYGYRSGGFDRSQRALRQAGSAFKPFVYAAAIDSGRYSAASLVNDAPEVYDLWKPQNYERESFQGPVRLRTALAHSINTVSIRLLADLGVPLVRDMAMRAGIASELPDSLGLSMALGAASVTPIELANAYATFANGGSRAEPRLLVNVGADTAPATQARPAMRAETAFIVVSLMRSVVEEGTAHAVAARLRRPVAGKTGTSNDYKDAWFVGFTPDLLAAVWVGYDDGRKLGRGEAGSRTALPIWTEFMAKALANRPVRDFPQPPGVLVVPIDPSTGLLAGPGGPSIEEVFIDGTAPTEIAPAHGEESSADKILLEREEPPVTPRP